MTTVKPEKKLTYKVNSKLPEKYQVYYTRLLNDLKKYGYTTAGQYVEEILVEQCLAQMEWDSGFKQFLEYMKENGTAVEADQEGMRRFADRLFKLRFLKKMIHATGMGAQEEQILALEIENIWAIRKPMQVTKTLKKPSSE